MAGLYLHIPFCKQACHYCNFHFSTSLRYKKDMVKAIGKELILRKTYLEEVVASIYLGGGTPSLLSAEELAYLFDIIHQHYDVSPEAEITLEANPDDIDQSNLSVWRSSPINRLSIGVQSFADEDLVFMNRAHSATEASRCIAWAQQAGFNNLTVDLIYGTPTTTDKIWEANVRQLIDGNIPHISCYALTVESRTALAHQIKTGKTAPLDEEQAARQFEKLIEWLSAADYLHYEISNFAQPGHLAVHNSSYWLAKPYLGIGPSAHSFNGHSRQWNIANNAKYMAAIDQWTKAGNTKDEHEHTLFELETLSPTDQYNEYVMTGLRTTWGVDIDRLKQPYKDHFIKKIHQFVNTGHITNKNKKYFLTPAGRLLADGIASNLFY